MIEGKKVKIRILSTTKDESGYSPTTEQRYEGTMLEKSGYNYVVYEILKYFWEEIITFAESFFERKIDKFINDGSRELGSVRGICNVSCKWFKQWNLYILLGLGGKDLNIFIGYILHSAIKYQIKITFCLLVP